MPVELNQRAIVFQAGSNQLTRLDFEARTSFTKLFPAGTDPDIIAAWRAEQKVLLKSSAAVKGTLAKDIEEYLKIRSSMPSFQDRKRDLEAWLPRFGKRSRQSITPAEITSQLNQWLEERDHSGVLRYAPNTVKHRRDALSNLYRILGGPNPTQTAVRVQDAEAVDRAISMRDVRAILSQMEKNALDWGPKARTVSLSWIRATILAYTGMRAGELMNLVETDVRLQGEDPIVIVRTSKGGRPRRIPLRGRPFMLRVSAWSCR